MKKIILLSVFIFLNILFLFSQPSIQWSKAYGGSSNDYGTDIHQTADGGYIVAGYSASGDSDVTTNNGGRDFWIVRLNSAGNIQWQKSYGGSSDEAAYRIQQLSNGGYVVAGYTQSNDSDVTGNHGQRDCWIVVLDSSGNLEKQRALGGTGFDVANSIVQTPDGGFAIVGYSDSDDGDVTFNRGAQDYWIVKLDSQLFIQWQFTYGGTVTEEAQSIGLTSDGGYIVCGYTYSSNGGVTGHHGGKDGWILKLDSLGVIAWKRTVGGSGNDQLLYIEQTSDAGYIAAGSSGTNNGDVSVNKGGLDYWIIKLDSTGVIGWEKSLGGSLDDVAQTVRQTNDGGYIVAGYTASNDSDVTVNNGNTDYWIVKLNAGGNPDWQLSQGGTNFDGAFSIEQTNDNGYIVSGNVNSNDGDITGSHGLSDYWILKLDAFTSFVSTPVANASITVYPNPFSDATRMLFSVPTAGPFKVEVRDIHGRLINQLLSGRKFITFRELVWDGTGSNGQKVSDGLYFVTLIADNVVETKKVVLRRAF